MVESPASLVFAMANRHGRTVRREVAGDFYQVSLQAMSTPVALNRPPSAAATVPISSSAAKPAGST